MEGAGPEVLVYDPPLCCASGVCGPSVDPALAQAAADFSWLATQGATVRRYNLAQEPEAFAAAPKIAGLLAAFDDAALPAVLVDGNVLTYGRYPDRAELLQATKVGPQALKMAPQDASSGCTPGGGCC